MSKKTISIIIPVYKVEKYIRRCLDSVVLQSVIPHEVICVDDGSPDNSKKICCEYAEKYPFIKVVSRENGGLSAARNTGIKAATGDYILFVDSDDTIDKDTIERFAFEIGNENPDIVVGNMRKVHGNTITHQNSYQSDSKIIMRGAEYFKQELKHGAVHMAAPKKLCRKEFLIGQGLFFEEGILHEDELFTPMIFYKAAAVMPTGIEFYNHIIRDGSITQQKNRGRNAESIIRVCHLLENQLDGCGDKEFKTLVLDHAVSIYFKEFVNADLINHPDLRLEKIYLKNNGVSIKNRLRYAAYSISENLFVRLQKMVDKGKR